MTTLAVKEWESKQALLQYLESADGASVVVGEDAEAPRRFYSCNANLGSTALEVGVLSSGLGSAPAVVAVDGGRTLLVGHDAWLTLVSLEKHRIDTERRLAGVFFEFLPIDDHEVIVVHELGAFRFAGDGAVKWNVDTDVVEDYRVDDFDTLVLSIMDEAKPVAVAIATGVVR